MGLEYKDYYKTLGVPREAGEDELKKAFRKLARKYHPDTATDKKAAEEKFKEINEAYEVLGDKEKRKRYDELGPDWQQGPSPAGAGGGFRRARGAGGPMAGGEDFEFGGTGFSDFFEHMFGGRGQRAPGGFGGFGGYPGEAEEGPSHGQDLNADLLVTLEEASQGAERVLSLRRRDRATGIERTETLKVRVPPGVSDGQRIRVAGKGEPGPGRGPAGDLYLTVRLQKHPDFRVEGSDLYYDLELAPWEAALGAKKNVTTLQKAVTLTVPPGAGTGQQLRLKGLGLPKRDGTRGDLYAVLAVQVPAAKNAAQKKLWEQLREAHGE
jgi:curved DNA-binding protein